MVLIPALNEASCVGETVRSWLELGAGRVRVVDNGSIDETSRIASLAGAEVLVERCRGYGAAAWRGLQQWPADCVWVLFSSADGSDRLSVAELASWQAAVSNGADLVLGNRTYWQVSRRELKFIQRFGNGVSCRAIALGWGRSFKDMASLRLVRWSAIEQMRLQDRGFGWNVEMQVRAIELGLSIVELPVRYFPRLVGESKISGNLAGSFRAGIAILRTLGVLWRWHRRRASRITKTQIPVCAKASRTG